MAGQTLNLQPTVANLKLYAGDDKTIQLKLWADTAKTTPMNVTGLTFKAQLRKKRTSDDTAMWVIVVSAPVIGNPTYINLTFTKAVLAAAPTTCVWDIQVTDASGNVTTWITGDVEVEKDVTR